MLDFTDNNISERKNDKASKAGIPLLKVGDNQLMVKMVKKNHDEKCSNTMEVNAHLYKAHPLLEIRLDDFLKNGGENTNLFPNS